MRIYVQVTPDEYELPVAVADSPEELAEITGHTVGTIKTTISKRKNGKRKGKFLYVEVEEDAT